MPRSFREPGNHVFYQQINIENIAQSFVAVAGQTYWLSVLVDWTAGEPPRSSSWGRVKALYH